MSRVFLCHQGEGSRDVAGRIGDRLCEEFGARHVVHCWQVDSRSVRKAAAECDVLLVVLGQRPRFDDPDDIARQAIETALELSLTVIPARIASVEFPISDSLPESLRQMLFQNGLQLRRDPHFHRDVARLVECVRNPASLLQPPAPDDWVVGIFASSFRPMCWGAILFSLYVPIAGVATVVLFGPVNATWFLVAMYATVPGLAGLVVGIRHGWLGGLIGALFGLSMPLAQFCGFYVVGEQLFNLAATLGLGLATEIADYGMIVLPTHTLSCTLFWGAYATRRAVATESDQASLTNVLSRNALLGGVSGLVLATILWIAVANTSDQVSPVYRITAGLSVLILIGAQLGLLDTSLSQLFRRRK